MALSNNQTIQPLAISVFYHAKLSIGIHFFNLHTDNYLLVIVLFCRWFWWFELTRYGWLRLILQFDFTNYQLTWSHADCGLIYINPSNFITLWVSQCRMIELINNNLMLPPLTLLASLLCPEMFDPAILKTKTELLDIYA